MRRARLLVASVVVAAVGLTGCGQSDDRDSVRAITEELESQESRPCADAVAEVELEPGAVTRVEVAVTNAKVDLASGESVQLAAGWRISALGCTPQGPPADEPLDCELQA